MKNWIIGLSAALVAALVTLPVLADELEITRWADGLEWFLEAEPLAAGESRTFLVHATRLDEHSPVTGGSVALALHDGNGDVVAQGVAEAERPGIFPVALELPAAGRYALVGRHEGPEGERSSDLGEVDIPDAPDHDHAHDNDHRHDDAHDHEDDHEHPHGIWSWIRHWFSHEHDHDGEHGDHEDDHHDDDGDAITFLKETQWRMNFAATPARREGFAERIEVPGTIREAPGARARLIAPATGVVTAAESWPQYGRGVERGEPMMRLTLLPDAGAASGLALDVARARERLAAAEAEFERLTALAEEGVVAESRVVEARRERNTARAELEDARERQGHLGGDADPGAIVLRAPADGRVESLEVGPGEVVQAGQQLATVLDGERLWLVAHLYPADLERVRTLADPMVRQPGNRDWHALEGEPVWESGEFEAPGQLLRVAFGLEAEASRYRPGMPVTVAMATEAPRERILLPRQALIDDDGVAVVIVQTGGESFERRPVRTGMRAAGRVEIVSGLEAGERVVTEGAYAVLLAGRDTDDAGHGHAH
ncbi:efflux RND transporter periplasmic adaptor subunit [Aquisalimonas asiatica]|uniref:RND family efflux transporter, MFP subunit n=1 Tax=Aquisalimonas asiatica TaxID=406100 RepID=A0A1H8T2J3_9GAMM|nr:efflux RND transporter periplasmic adaptor subunit [Aquisalimonas asiatica]SEO84926.1 RND family efflux transporter, MFP subunit [Aquisalimonas asiatica]